MGVEWAWDMDSPIIPDDISQGSGHAIYCLGWKRINGQDYLVIQNSYGSTGDNGKYYLPRKVIDKYVKTYGAFMFIDMPAEEIKKKAWSWLLKLIERIKRIWK